MNYRAIVLALAFGLATTVPPLVTLGASPTPVPGGANQLQGVQGGLPSTLFNGRVRVRKMTFGKPNQSSGESFADNPSTVWFAYHALMSNGTKRALDMQQFQATIVDADGVAIAAQPDKVRPMGSVNGIPPGGAWREAIFFNVPPGFVPVKIVLQPSDAHDKAFRITLAPGDLPPS